MAVCIPLTRYSPCRCFWVINNPYQQNTRSRIVHWSSIYNVANGVLVRVCSNWVLARFWASRWSSSLLAFVLGVRWSCHYTTMVSCFEFTVLQWTGGMGGWTLEWGFWKKDMVKGKVQMKVCSLSRKVVGVISILYSMKKATSNFY